MPQHTPPIPYIHKFVFTSWHCQSFFVRSFTSYAYTVYQWTPIPFPLSRVRFFVTSPLSCPFVFSFFFDLSDFFPSLPSWVRSLLLSLSFPLIFSSAISGFFITDSLTSLSNRFILLS